MMANRKKPVQQSEAGSWEIDDQKSRNLAKREMKEAHEILRPFIRFGQKLLRASGRELGDPLDGVIAFSFRQTLEFVDGVDLLLRHHMVTPAGAQARSALESGVQTCYLSLRGTDRLAIAYLLAQLKSRRLLYEGRMRVPNVSEGERKELADLAGGMWSGITEFASKHPASAEVLKQINALGDGEPWFRVFKGPRNIHEIIKILDLPPLSIYYKELNSVVHVGLPTAGLARSAQGTEAGEPTEWLRPLRSVTDWWTMPLKVSIVSASLATQAFIVHYNSRYPYWIDEFLIFEKEHGERCSRAGMPELALAGEMVDQVVEFRASQQRQQPS